MENNPEKALIYKQRREGREGNYRSIAESVADNARLANSLSAEIAVAGGLGAFEADRLERFALEHSRELDALAVLEEDFMRFVMELASELERRKMSHD